MSSIPHNRMGGYFNDSCKKLGLTTLAIDSEGNANFEHRIRHREFGVITVNGSIKKYNGEVTSIKLVPVVNKDYDRLLLINWNRYTNGDGASLRMSFKSSYGELITDIQYDTKDNRTTILRKFNGRKLSSNEDLESLVNNDFNLVACVINHILNLAKGDDLYKI